MATLACVVFVFAQVQTVIRNAMGEQGISIRAICDKLHTVSEKAVR